MTCWYISSPLSMNLAILLNAFGIPTWLCRWTVQSDMYVSTHGHCRSISLCIYTRTSVVSTATINSIHILAHAGVSLTTT